jgi:hypothetical protein
VLLRKDKRTDYTAISFQWNILDGLEYSWDMDFQWRDPGYEQWW